MPNFILIDDSLGVDVLDGFSTTKDSEFTPSLSYSAPAYDHCLAGNGDLCLYAGGSGVSRLDGISSTETDTWAASSKYGITTDRDGNFLLSANTGGVQLYDDFDGSQIDTDSRTTKIIAWGDDEYLFAENGDTPIEQRDGFSSTVLASLNESSMGDGDKRGITWDGADLYRSVRNVTDTARQFDGFSTTELDDVQLSYSAWGIEQDDYTLRVGQGSIPGPLTGLNGLVHGGLTKGLLAG